tara:strand:- start:724 stop:1248 length:525 start_codon:yes stop_codon:yes gene_type:complete
VHGAKYMKVIISTVLCIMIAIIAIPYSQLRSMPLESLIICASNEGGIRIPAKVCEIYLHSGRNIQEDIVNLNQNDGLTFILHGKNAIKYDIAQFYIDNGLDINSLSKTTNLTPLYDAVLLNDIENMSFLLENNASLSIPSYRKHPTAIDYAEALQKNDNIDRMDIIRLLKSKQK